MTDTTFTIESTESTPESTEKVPAAPVAIVWEQPPARKRGGGRKSRYEPVARELFGHLGEWARLDSTAAATGSLLRKQVDKLFGEGYEVETRMSTNEDGSTTWWCRIVEITEAEADPEVA